MKKLVIRILIFCMYCFPFVYYSMYQDFEYGSLFGYLIMIVGTSILAFFVKISGKPILFIIGNIATGLISLYFVYKMEVTYGIGWDEGYFKPLTPYQLLLLVSVLNLIPQFLVMKLTKTVKK